MELTQLNFEVITDLKDGTLTINQPSNNMVFGSDMVVINFNQIDELIKLLQEAKYAIDIAHLFDPITSIKPILSLVKQ